MEITYPVRKVLLQKGSQVYALGPEASVYEAIELMSDKGVGALLVMRGDRLVGFVSERDYARKVVLRGKSSRDTRIEEIMSAPVRTIPPGTSIEDAMRIMTANRIRHLPIVEDGRVEGVVSIGDLVKWIVTAQEQTIRHLKEYIAGAYPG
ncbi:MAG: CBS domain-containing protein [Bryobacteraceae bacterium]|nr:CBS domain-containing protein [Bryobacteraceae bacterium]